MILGKYEVGTQTISLDTGSHLFRDESPVIYHELTHYWLSKFTNFGSVHSILGEIVLRPDLLVVDPASIKAAMGALHKESYMPQEGLAHFMQAAKIFSNGGMDAVKQFEDKLPNQPKISLSHMRFAVAWEPSDRLNKLTEKIAPLAMNTDIHEEVIRRRDAILFDPSALATYLASGSHSPNKRFEKLCVAVEKDPDILMLEDEEICRKASIDFHSSMSNVQKAALNNVLTALTKNPTNLTEGDIKTLDGPNEVFMPAVESLIIRDSNIETDAIVGAPEEAMISEIPLIRTIFVFNNPESPTPPDKFGFYSFSRRRVILNGRLPIGQSAARIFNDKSITKISDTASYDYSANTMRPERSFVNPDIIWYKNYNDLKIFLEMIESLGIRPEWASIAFTDPHPFWFYIFRIPEQPYLHVLVGYPYLAPKFNENKNLAHHTDDFFALIKGVEAPLNNFLHDIIGVPFQLSLVDMLKDAEAHLERAKSFNKNGIGRNDPCICGSKRKYKRCHLN
jgi:hypothetical protein